MKQELVIHHWGKSSQWKLPERTQRLKQQRPHSNDCKYVQLLRQ